MSGGPALTNARVTHQPFILAGDAKLGPAQPMLKVLQREKPAAATAGKVTVIINAQLNAGIGARCQPALQLLIPLGTQCVTRLPESKGSGLLSGIQSVIDHTRLAKRLRHFREAFFTFMGGLSKT